MAVTDYLLETTTRWIQGNVRIGETRPAADLGAALHLPGDAGDLEALLTYLEQDGVVTRRDAASGAGSFTRVS